MKDGMNFSHRLTGGRLRGKPSADINLDWASKFILNNFYKNFILSELQFFY